MRTPSEQDVRDYFDALGNWGRWGEADQIGTLNLITRNKRLEASRLIREGITVGCARPIVEEHGAPDVDQPPLHFMIRTGPPMDRSAADFIGLAPHGRTITHIDTLGHCYWNGRIYNGHDPRLISTKGARICGVETMSDGILTRGVLLDMTRLKGKPYLEPGDAIYPQDLDDAERMANVRVGPGDALLVRTGWSKRRQEVGPPRDRNRPGLHAAALPWLRSRDVAVLAADVSQDVQPSGYDDIPYPIHDIGIAAMGLCLIDSCQFDALAELCVSLSRWEFAFAVAALNFPGATASPVSPLALL